MDISISAEHILHFGPFVITNSMLSSFVVLIALSIFAIVATKKMDKIPKGIQNVAELGIESLLKLANSVTKNEKLSQKIFPLIATFFIFILFNNWIGLVPGVGSVGIHEIGEGGVSEFIPLFRAGTADLNTTIILGIIAIIAVQIVGMASLGALKYSKKFFNFSSPINFFVGILELISEFVRIVSFAFRLFGNVFAGEVLLTILSVLVPFVVPLPFYIMELFVGFIQALVFTMIALVFMSMATISHDHESHEVKETPELA